MFLLAKLTSTVQSNHLYQYPLIEKMGPRGPIVGGNA